MFGSRKKFEVIIESSNVVAPAGSELFQGRHVRLALFGVLDEDAQLPDMGEIIRHLRLLGSGVSDADIESQGTGANAPVLIDFSGLSGLNSWGVRSWVEFINNFEKNGIDLIFDGCSVGVIHQLMMTNRPGRSVRLHRFDTEYFCSDCENVEIVTIKYESFDEAIESTPMCPVCGGDMEVEGDLQDVRDWLKAS